MNRHLAVSVLLCCALWVHPIAAQQFDNFGETTLPPLPEAPEGTLLPEGVNPLSDGAIGENDPLSPSWLDGDAVILPPADNGVAIGPGRPGQNGILIERPTGNGSPSSSVNQQVTEIGSRITLRALDRMLGRPTDIELGIGQTVLFGRIAIHVPECRFPADNPSSDAFAHIQVLDTGGNTLFDGWMVASSPALSALEHPRYDVWVLRCATTS